MINGVLCRLRAAGDLDLVRDVGVPATATAELTALEEVLADLADAADAVADALLVEGVHQAVQGNPLRAGATLDAMGNGEAPPPELESLRTPRGGDAVTHRVIVLLRDTGTAVPAGLRALAAGPGDGAGDTPPIIAPPPTGDGSGTLPDDPGGTLPDDGPGGPGDGDQGGDGPVGGPAPTAIGWATDPLTQTRALAEPALDAWLTALLPAPATVTYDVRLTDGTTRAVPLAGAPLSPLDWLALGRGPQALPGSDLERHLLLHADHHLAGREPAAPRPVSVEPESQGLAPLLETVRAARELLRTARPLRPADLALPEADSPPTPPPTRRTTRTSPPAPPPSARSPGALPPTSPSPPPSPPAPAWNACTAA